MKKLFLTTIVTLLVANFQLLKAQDATSILKKVDEQTSGWKDLWQNVEITLIDKNNKQETRTADIIQKGDDMRLLKFTSPESQKGVGFLSLPNEVMYLYMPAFGKERRIATSVKNQKFAGTDLSYDDLEAKKYSEKYKATISKSDAKEFTLVLTPKTAGEYSKVILVVDAQNYTPKAADFYDKSNKIVKSTTFVFAKSVKYWYAETLTVKDLKTSHTTTVKTKNVKFDQNLKDDLFTIRNLMK